jgi:NADH-quinone oxidoreductase subunit J
VLVYIGAVMVLFLFGVMLTRARIGTESNLNNKRAAIGIPVALLLFAAMAIALIGGFKDEKLPGPGADAARIHVNELSDSIFDPYLLPFWALSFILLVAVVGAIVLARKD